MNEKLKNLLAKPKEYKIKGENILIYPIKLQDADLLFALSSKDESKSSSALIKLIIKTVKGAFPDATEEDLNCLDVSVVKELSDAILDVNGLGDSKN